MACPTQVGYRAWNGSIRLYCYPTDIGNTTSGGARVIDPREWRYPRILLAVLLGVILLSMLAGGTIATSDYSVFNAGWDGASTVKQLAVETGSDPVVLLETARYQELDPNSTVAIVLSPESTYAESEQELLRSFVEQGGTVVIADDFRPHSNTVLSGIGASARIDRQPVRDQYARTQTPAFPRATRISNHTLTANVSALALNYPSAVTSNNATTLVKTSNYTYLDANYNAELDENESVQPYPVVTRESVGDGHVIVMSDSSVFINAMNEKPGNRQFISNIIDRHETVALDYTHSGSQPPLSVALVYLRRIPYLQAGLGVLLSVSVGLFIRWQPLRNRSKQFDNNIDLDETTQRALESQAQRLRPEDSNTGTANPEKDDE